MKLEKILKLESQRGGRKDKMKLMRKERWENERFRIGWKFGISELTSFLYMRKISD